MVTFFLSHKNLTYNDIPPQNADMPLSFKDKKKYQKEKENSISARLSLRTDASP